MRQKRIIILVLMVCAGFITCKRQDANTSPAIYISGTSSVSELSIYMEPDGGNQALTISSTSPAPTAITGTLSTDTNLVAIYNQIHSTNYYPLPASFHLDKNQVTISAGQIQSDTSNLIVETLDQLMPGRAYMLPVTISSVTGPLRILKPSATVYYIIKKIIRESAINLANKTYFTVPAFMTDTFSYKSLQIFTYECRVYVNTFSGATLNISSILGGENDFAMRFGDVPIPANTFQAFGTGISISDLFQEKQWYHIAETYDGATVKIYVDGIFKASASINSVAPLGKTVAPNIWAIGATYNNRLLNGYMNEVRIWTKALSQREILDGMCGVDPASNGLLAYWKFDEGKGDTAYDATGHNYNAVSSTKNPLWVPNVACPQLQ